jgi:hypothetical protein
VRFALTTDPGNPGTKEITLKGSVVLASIIIALALAIWSFFYIKNLPLTPSETTVVVGICAAVALSGKWIWSSLRKRGGKENEKKS